MSRTIRSGFYIESHNESMETSRDKKKHYKPDKQFKKIRNRLRKAKIKDAMRKQKELPVFKQSDIWGWN